MFHCYSYLAERKRFQVQQLLFMAKGEDDQTITNMLEMHENDIFLDNGMFFDDQDYLMK